MDSIFTTRRQTSELELRDRQEMTKRQRSVKSCQLSILQSNGTSLKHSVVSCKFYYCGQLKVIIELTEDYTIV